MRKRSCIDLTFNETSESISSNAIESQLDSCCHRKSIPSTVDSSQISRGSSDITKFNAHLEYDSTQLTKSYSLDCDDINIERSKNKDSEVKASKKTKRKSDPSFFDLVTDCSFNVKMKACFFSEFIQTYGRDYFKWLSRQETTFRPVPYIQLIQRGMRADMRTMLVDWLIEVCTEYKIQVSTIFHVVELLDRSLSSFQLSRSNLQLLGSTCLLLASKFEEKKPPEISALVHISDSAFEANDVVDMEDIVLSQLDYRLYGVTPHHFLALFATAARCDIRQSYLSMYILELSMLDYSLVKYLPSHKAASAVLLARMTMDRAGNPWPPEVVFVTGYEKTDLSGCVRQMRKLHEQDEESQFHAVRNRYTKADRFCVAYICCMSEPDLSFE